MKHSDPQKLKIYVSLSTQALLLDVRLARMWFQGNRSEKLVRIMKKSTKRAQRRFDLAQEEMAKYDEAIKG